MSSGVRFGDGTFESVPRGTDDALETAYEHSRRSAVCLTLLEDGDASVDRLAARVAALESHGSEGDVAESTRRNVHVSLHHRHLPKLDDAGVVDWDRTDGRVWLSADGDLERDRLTSALESTTRRRVGTSLTDRASTRRQRLRALLADCDGTVSVAELAQRAVAAERGVSTDDVSASEAEDVHVRLRHVHLPAMAETEPLEYDPERGVVSLE